MKSFYLIIFLLPLIFCQYNIDEYEYEDIPNPKNITCDDLFNMWLLSTQGQCDLITDAYETFCEPDDDDFFGGDPPEWCEKLQDKYKKQCDPEKEKELSSDLLWTLLALVFCIVAASYLELINFYLVAGSGITIIVGLILGGGAWLENSDSRFSEQFFFLFLIPPILFQAGIEIDKEMLLVNFGTIMVFAFVETIFATLIVFGILAYTGFLPSLECAVFGALISAVDPIAILAIFNNFNVEKDLFTMVFGESALNDGVAVVIYNLLYSALTNEVGDRTIDPLKMVYTCVYVFIGSAALGIAFALSSSLFFKHYHFSKLEGVRETAVIILWSLIPYYIAEIVGISGIVTILFEGIFIDLYTYHNLSGYAKEHFHFLTSSFAYVCETMIFAYLGVEIVLSPGEEWKYDLILTSLGAVLVSRLSIFPLSWLLNLIRKEPIEWAHQVGMWFAGLRGGCAFALAYNIPEWNSVLGTGTKYRGQIISVTIAVILMEVFIFGSSLIIPVLKWNGLKVSSPSSSSTSTSTSHHQSDGNDNNNNDNNNSIDEDEESDFNPRSENKHQINNIQQQEEEEQQQQQQQQQQQHRQLEEPISDNNRMMISKGGPKYSKYQQWLIYFHQKYMVPFFTNRPANMNAIRPDSLAVDTFKNENQSLLNDSENQRFLY